MYSRIYTYIYIPKYEVYILGTLQRARTLQATQKQSNKCISRVKGLRRLLSVGDKLKETKTAPEVDKVGFNILPLATAQRLRAVERAERRVADVYVLVYYASSSVVVTVFWHTLPSYYSTSQL